MQLKHFFNTLNKLYPIELQEKWDNCGLLVGRLESEVKKVLTTLDVTHEVIEHAIEQGVNLIVSHHPVIFDGMKSITSKTSHGDKVLKLIENKIAVISMHTNVDKHPEGLNDYLIKKLSGKKGKFLNSDMSQEVKLVIKVPFEDRGLLAWCEKSEKSGEILRYFTENESVCAIVLNKDLKKMINMIQCLSDVEYHFEAFPLANGQELGGLGNYFVLEKPMKLNEYIEHVKQSLQIERLSVVARTLDKEIRKVAVVSGGGASLMKESYKKEIDLYITGDVNYHIAQDAKDYNLALLDIGHFESEVIFCELLEEKIATFFSGEVIKFGGENPFKRV